MSTGCRSCQQLQYTSIGAQSLPGPTGDQSIGPISTDEEVFVETPPPPTSSIPSKLERERMPRKQKFFIVIHENNDFAKIIQRPFYKELADRGTLLTNFHGLFHPSQPNYLALIAGTNTFTTAGGNVETVTNDVSRDGPLALTGPNLGDLLDKKDISWKVYAENYPGACRTLADMKGCPEGPCIRTLEKHNCSLCPSFGSTTCNFPILSKTFQCRNYYVRYHNPFLAFTSLQNNPARCISHVTTSSALYQDIERGTLPQVSFYIPGQNNNAHDTDLDYSDTSLEQTFRPLLSDPRFMTDMVFIVMFDENGTWKDDPTNNQTYLVMVGPNVRSGVSLPTYYTHYNVLRTIEDYFNVGTLGRNDATADPIQGFFKPVPHRCSRCKGKRKGKGRKHHH